MKGPLLVGQLIAEERLNPKDAAAVAMMAALADAGRPLEAAARAAGLGVGHARNLALRFGITFRSGGPA